MSILRIFTDGSCYSGHERKLGGYGVLFDYKPYSKGYCNTTISRMELRAMIKGLSLIKKSGEYEMYSDSMYCINSINKWIDKWAAENWNGRKNKDLLIELYNQKQRLKKIKGLKLKVIHTRGHQKSDNPISMGNNIADKLADYKNFKNYQKDGI